MREWNELQSFMSLFLTVIKEDERGKCHSIVLVPRLIGSMSFSDVQKIFCDRNSNQTQRLEISILKQWPISSWINQDESLQNQNNFSLKKKT